MQITDRKSIRLTLALCLFANISVGDAQGFTISVHSEHGEGVQSNIFYAVESDRSLIGRTDENGHLLPETPCSEPQEILAEPVSLEYLPGKIYCSVDTGTVVVKVFNRQFTQRIARALEGYAGEGHNAFEALLANEMYARYAASDTAVAESYRVLIEPAITEYLIADGWLTGNQTGIDVNEFEAAIRNLQGERGLNPTGILDYQTLSAAARIDIGEVIAIENFQLREVGIR